MDMKLEITCSFKYKFMKRRIAAVIESAQCFLSSDQQVPLVRFKIHLQLKVKLTDCLSICVTKCFHLGAMGNIKLKATIPVTNGHS
ncbi:hypothetical protein T10_176 [Trichinella papuae]|uniref:Uncharacterized protein n=1 Tax=Trichinella papuae TaxID=268474 RepID=A0A0V1MJ76_9BILA|nr:hypothetical protein T10_176 [Trichinella papuae]